MSAQFYKSFDFKRETLAMISTLSKIAVEYMAQGYTLTVRQLYYQMVARGHIENTERSYKRVTGVVNDARLAGMIDWDAIEDRTREFIKRSRWRSGAAILSSVAAQFHMDQWVGQERRVFVIVEKEALAGVLEGVCRQYDMPLLAARGYPSGTVLREFAVSDLQEAFDQGQEPVILHLGDHDPSGIDMSRDLTERTAMFTLGAEVEFIRIALNMEQIQKQKPPPNPAKTTDSRFAAYRAKFGIESWELDALKPNYLAALVQRHARKFISRQIWDARADEIAEVKNRLAQIAETF